MISRITTTDHFVRTLLLLFILTATGGLCAEERQVPTAGEKALKVAFIYNFIKFSRWPANHTLSQTPVLRACVFGRIEFRRQLATIDGKQISDHRVEVKYIGKIEQGQACHILFVGFLEPKLFSALLTKTKDAPVLTISDNEAFSTSGGMIEIFQSDQKLQFKINNKKVNQVGIKLSSKVLKLAEIVE